MENLPLELKVQIALVCSASYVAMLVDRDFALWTLSHQSFILKTLIREEREGDNIYRYIGDRLLYHPDIPSIELAEIKLWKKNGVIHRDRDQPAEVWESKIQIWYVHGQVHRDGDKPAMIYENTTQIWYRFNKNHRDEDKPAIIRPDGSREWYIHGELHRDGDQPAIILPDGTKKWYIHGTLIREEK